MTCPYTVNTLVIEQTKNEYNALGNCDSYETVTKTVRSYLKCKQEDCGAWRDGACHYKDN